MFKDDLSIHASIPEKAVKGALRQLTEALPDVSWDLGRSRPGRPIRVFFEAATMPEIQQAKQQLEQLLNAAGFDLYP